MFKPTDDIVCSTTLTQLLSSDHYCVVCDLSAIKPVNHAEAKQSRHLRDINLTTFKADICQLISPTSCSSFEMLCDSIRLILEKQTSLSSCRVPINRNDPWYNKTKSDIITAKQQALGRKTVLRNLTILNNQQFSKAKIMHKAKSEYYLSEINSAT